MPAPRGADDSAAYLSAPDDGAPDAWTAATRDEHGSQRLLEVAQVVPPREVADALEQGPQEVAVVRRRLMLLDGRPVEIANSYYPILLAADTPLADDKKIKGGAPRALANLGYTIAYGDQAVELEAYPDENEAALLEVGPGTRVVRLFRTAYTETHTPIEVTTSVMIPAGRVLRDRILVG